ncbi:hypothetical protein BN8_04843 [Fibrisoma limi BUZ 3]|uniref:DUF5681 domain-containing protein n=1 Tax=Fibrisoma limi BUZ 3 TaxID=1185876 RepID=I2GNU8_9BACT|nr:DUF5681 domain-containing protein [Fibrisoma limi]CCH55576.1 hypothetical protein BN8_04843 [Fibrisoma limi BUZ 3]
MRDDIFKDGIETRFQKGQSGNPNGRPKGSKGKAKLIRRCLNLITKADNPVTGELTELSVEELITLAIMAKAIQGDTMAYRVIMDSAYGKLK